MTANEAARGWRAGSGRDKNCSGRREVAGRRVEERGNKWKMEGQGKQGMRLGWRREGRHLDPTTPSQIKIRSCGSFCNLISLPGKGRRDEQPFGEALLWAEGKT